LFVAKTSFISVIMDPGAKILKIDLSF
jgi:hypothetical protein